MTLPARSDRSGASGASAASAAGAADQLPALASQNSSPSSAGAPVFRLGSHKSCDTCKARKVKCPNDDYPGPCGNCLRRKETCHFGKKKVPRRNVTKHLRFTRSSTAAGAAASPQQADSTTLRYVDLPDDKETPAVSEASSNNAFTDDNLIPKLYVDHLLAQAQGDAGNKDDAPFEKGNGIFGGSYSLTFFSESRLRSLSERLHNDKVNELVRRINNLISGRLRRSADPVATAAAYAAHAAHPIHEPAAPLTPASSATEGTSSGGGGRGSSSEMVDSRFAATCIRCYFERAHPLYPFLDRAAFEVRALPGANNPAGQAILARNLARSKAWSSLYYAVLAIGCLYTDSAELADHGVNAGISGGGASSSSGSSNNLSFAPGKGTAWGLFARALANFSDLLILPDSLLTLQALTAMAVYGLGVDCLSIERVILAEAARRAQSLTAGGNFPSVGPTATATVSASLAGAAGPAAAAPSSSAAFQRTFWVVYGIEKVMSFHFGRNSAFVDTDIACPFPHVPETRITGDGGGEDGNDGSDGDGTVTLDWFLLLTLHARLLSRTYAALFSVGTACNTPARSLATVDELLAEAEQWRRTIPDVRGMRPVVAPASPIEGKSSSSSRQRSSVGRSGGSPTERMVALAMSFLYHSLVLILSRAKLHHLVQLAADPAFFSSSSSSSTHQREVATCEAAILAAARAILELTPYVDVEPYTPLWILAVIPLSALLVLFDVVVHRPTSATAAGRHHPHPDTALDLALLDMGAGYFSRIEYASGSTVPGSLVSEFAHIARDYVNDCQRGGEQRGMEKENEGAAAAAAAIAQDQGPNGADGRRGRRWNPAPAAAGRNDTEVVQPPPPPPPQQAPPPSIPQRLLPPPMQPHIPLLSSTPTPAPPVPSPATLSNELSQQPSHLGLIDSPSTLPAAGWTAPTVGAADGVPLLNGMPNFGDGLGYGYGFGDYGAGGAAGGDLSGTDVMGLFTSTSFFLPEMDAALLFNGPQGS